MSLRDLKPIYPTEKIKGYEKALSDLIKEAQLEKRSNTELKSPSDQFDFECFLLAFKKVLDAGFEVKSLGRTIIDPQHLHAGNKISIFMYVHPKLSDLEENNGFNYESISYDENISYDDEIICNLCLDRPFDTKLLPCEHTCCYVCSDTLVKSVCPWCERDVVEFKTL